MLEGAVGWIGGAFALWRRRVEKNLLIKYFNGFDGYTVLLRPAAGVYYQGGLPSRRSLGACGKSILRTTLQVCSFVVEVNE